MAWADNLGKRRAAASGGGRVLSPSERISRGVSPAGEAAEDLPWQKWSEPTQKQWPYDVPWMTVVRSILGMVPSSAESIFKNAMDDPKNLPRYLQQLTDTLTRAKFGPQKAGLPPPKTRVPLLQMFMKDLVKDPSGWQTRWQTLPKMGAKTPREGGQPLPGGGREGMWLQDLLRRRPAAQARTQQEMKAESAAQAARQIERQAMVKRGAQHQLVEDARLALKWMERQLAQAKALKPH